MSPTMQYLETNTLREAPQAPIPAALIDHAPVARS